MVRDPLFYATIAGTFGVIFANDRFRHERPAKRVVIGCAGMCLSLLAYIGMNRFLPRPVPGENALLHEIAALAASAFVALGAVFSAMQILGGAVQSFKRWRYYRRNPHINR
ncbi:hypothetical protein ABC974_07300 [Sphingomonas oligophenolica]|uniref:Uncharacterized protein n=1 Tax=Sphingomonas oligophenolica TaxID=301154 RepID=A0ABU9Y0T6_9SPHN